MSWRCRPSFSWTTCNLLVVVNLKVAELAMVPRHFTTVLTEASWKGILSACVERLSAYVTRQLVEAAAALGQILGDVCSGRFNRRQPVAGPIHDPQAGCELFQLSLRDRIPRFSSQARLRRQRLLECFASNGHTSSRLTRHTSSRLKSRARTRVLLNAFRTEPERKGVDASSLRFTWRVYVQLFVERCWTKVLLDPPAVDPRAL